jgi:hypothetical protein
MGIDRRGGRILGVLLAPPYEEKATHCNSIQCSDLWNGMFDIVDTRDALLGASVCDFDNCMITRAAYRPCRPSPAPFPEMHEKCISYWMFEGVVRYFWTAKALFPLIECAYLACNLVGRRPHPTHEILLTGWGNKIINNIAETSLSYKFMFFFVDFKYGN